MMLANSAQYCEQTQVVQDPSILRRSSEVEREELAKAGKAVPLGSPLMVAIEDVTCEGDDSPVKYSMRVTCFLDRDASWTMPPRRYSDFEALHKSVRNCDGLYAELPSKFMLVPSRAALISRAAGLQRYCNALLCNPAALGRAEVTDFFDLDQGLWRRTKAASDDERQEAVARLQGACRSFVVSAPRGSRAETKAAQAEAEAQADRALPKEGFGSPKRQQRATGEDEEELASTAQSSAKRVRGTPPPSKRAAAAGDGLPNVAETPSTFSALWGADERCGAGRKAVTIDVPLQRSGISDIVAGVSL